MRAQVKYRDGGVALRVKGQREQGKVVQRRGSQQDNRGGTLQQTRTNRDQESGEHSRVDTNEVNGGRAEQTLTCACKGLWEMGVGERRGLLNTKSI